MADTHDSQPIAFLGPEGTFCEESLLANLPEGDYHPFPYPSIQDALQAVDEGEADLGIVPIENSLEGSVPITLDSLAHRFDDLHIVREVTHDIRHQLIARRPLDLATVTKVVSIPHAYGQCRGFIREHLANVEHEATDSTAEAVRRVSRVDRPWVAIGTRLAAEMYECEIVAADIEDADENRTRFVFVSRKPAPQDLDAPYKTSLVCGIAQDQPGSLLMILSEFAYRFINLTRVESRPSKQALGHYIFFIDMEGRLDDPSIAQALKCLMCKLPWIKVLGSYPTAAE
jgi:prephenate dehydratase